MEHNALGNTSAPDGIPQCGDGKEPIDPPAHPAGDDLSGIQVRDRADITEPTTHRDIGKIANPDHIGCRLPELLGQQIDAICGVLRAGLRLWRFHGTHFGEIHLFHQPVHSTFTDGYAIFPRKTEFHFAGAQTLVRLGVDLQYPAFQQLVFLLPGRGLTAEMFVIGTAVDTEHPAQNGDPVLSGKRLNGAQSLPECGVKIAMAFFKMRFSSSSSALRRCSALTCWAVRTVSSSNWT